MRMIAVPLKYPLAQEPGPSRVPRPPRYEGPGQEGSVTRVTSAEPDRFAGHAVRPFQPGPLQPVRCARHRTGDEIESCPDLDANGDAQPLVVVRDPKFSL